jgi:hypothetical protein
MRCLFAQVFTFKYTVGYVYGIRARKANHSNGAHAVWCGKGNYGIGIICHFLVDG